MRPAPRTLAGKGECRARGGRLTLLAAPRLLPLNNDGLFDALKIAHRSRRSSGSRL
jgi:hypothetical protein